MDPLTRQPSRSSLIRTRTDPSARQPSQNSFIRTRMLPSTRQVRRGFDPNEEEKKVLSNVQSRQDRGSGGNYQAQTRQQEPNNRESDSNSDSADNLNRSTRVITRSQPPTRNTSMFIDDYDLYDFISNEANLNRIYYTRPI